MKLKRVGIISLGIIGIILLCLMTLLALATEPQEGLKPFHSIPDAVATQAASSPTPRPTRAPTPKPRAAWLSCLDCQEAGLQINLWKYDGEKRIRIVASLPHDSEVLVIGTDWNSAENRKYYLVKFDNKQGWISENFISWTRP